MIDLPAERHQPLIEGAAEVEQFQQLLPKAVRRLSPEVRYRAENALDGFARAKVLLSIDREIASFRAITAAEEAASALIRSLQLREYPGAHLVDLRRHPHKAAVPFFLNAVRHEIAGDKEINLVVTLSADPPNLTVALPLQQFVDLPDDLANVHLQLADPLGMIGSKPDVEEGDFFDAAVQRVAGSRKVDKLIASAANARNRILYAHDGGLLFSQATQTSIEQREQGAKLCLLLAIAVMQVDHHQGMALQCLAGFLKVIGRSGTS
ncbi:hypothetical protein [uncultured Sphingomonas sp.]|uniref:hypothetical protein n=1 Tax=uncultured Sphingomonas sp. TaxID=158754 RepID=UPI0035CCA9CE